MSYEKYDLVKLTNTIPLAVQHEISLRGMDTDGLFLVNKTIPDRGEVVLMQSGIENIRFTVKDEYTIHISKRISKGDAVTLARVLPDELFRTLTVDGVDLNGTFWVIDCSDLNSVSVFQPIGDGVQRVVDIPAEYLRFIREGLKVGDKVWLKPGAHSSDDSSEFNTPEKVLEELNHMGVEYSSALIVEETIDEWGDVCLVKESSAVGYIYVMDQYISLIPQKPLTKVVCDGTVEPSEVEGFVARVRRANEWIGIESGKLDSLLKLAGELK